MKERIDFSILRGLTLSEVEWSHDLDGDINFVSFDTTCDREFVMYHEQDCCECVYLQDVCGDIDDLIGSPITMAEEVCSDDDPDDYNQQNEFESRTWTFYKLATVKGYVTLRWLGSSNGYYSEKVSFFEHKDDEQ